MHESVPIPDLTGQEFDRIMREMESFRTWLYEHPDPKLLSVIYHSGCWCYQPEYNYLKGLEADSWRFADEGTVILSVRVLDRPKPDLAVLTVTNGHGPESVDSIGEIVQQGDGWPTMTSSLTFKRGGGWPMAPVRRRQGSTLIRGDAVYAKSPRRLMEILGCRPGFMGRIVTVPRPNRRYTSDD